MHNYYQILGCSETASVEEIKKKYRELILTSHPDKCLSSEESGVDFDLLNKAWQTLSNTKERKEYDARIKQETLSEEALLFDRLSLEELSYDCSNDTYSYKCRCGGDYKLDGQELLQLTPECSVECNSCSLLINVYFKCK